MSSDISTIGNTGTNPAPFGAAAGQAAPVPLPGSRPAPQLAAPDILQRAAQRVVAAMENGGVSFNFTIDKQSGMTIVRIFNKATGELVRQIPSEEAVHVAQLLRQDEQRSLLDLKV
jgi:flagellar protein FlaG